MNHTLLFGCRQGLWLRALGVVTLCLFASGCASWRMERVPVVAETESGASIAVGPPRVYHSSKGFLAAGSLRTKGLGAHLAPAGHLHAQLIDNQGQVVCDTTAPAPYIRHNRSTLRETTIYTIPLDRPPPPDGRLRVILHQYSLKRCLGV